MKYRIEIVELVNATAISERPIDSYFSEIKNLIFLGTLARF